VGIKTKNPKSQAINKIEIEAKFLKVLNKHNIGPKFIKGTKTYVMYEFVEGELLKDKIETMTKPKLKAILKNMVKQCYQMDNLGINKEEMHRPHKHIVLTKKGPIQLDFERCHYAEKMHNVTQFLQYIRQLRLIPQAKLLTLSKNYGKTNKIGDILKAL
jgi:putative serine/threonine protein kinase